jgi:hypothetical protein
VRQGVYDTGPHDCVGHMKKLYAYAFKGDNEMGWCSSTQSYCVHSLKALEWEIASELEERKSYDADDGDPPPVIRYELVSLKGKK